MDMGDWSMIELDAGMKVSVDAALAPVLSDCFDSASVGRMTHMLSSFFYR
jgi:hypothetical protein